MAVSAGLKTSQDVLRTAMYNLSKEEFVHIMLTMTDCLHTESGYRWVSLVCLVWKLNLTKVGQFVKSVIYVIFSTLMRSA